MSNCEHIVRSLISSFYRSMRTDSCFEQYFQRELYLYTVCVSCVSDARAFTIVCFAVLHIHLKLFIRKEIVADHSVRTSIASLKLPLASALRKYFDYTCIHYMIYIVLSCTESRTKKKRIFLLINNLS